MLARIYKSTGSWYTAKTEDGAIYNARMKGIFKIDDITSTNPVAVGDIVEIEMEDAAGNNAIINNIYERKNYIARNSPRNKKQQHIIASNIDQALLLATLKEPRTSQGFIDRCLVAAEAYHIPSLIVFNKTDIYKKKEWDNFDKLKKIYESIHYPVYAISVKTNDGLDTIKSLLKNNTTLGYGHSGTGKSTFINYLLPHLGLRTKEVSNWSGKGMHTTTFAEMHDLPFGGRIIDTPGIREFALTNMERTELSHYFPEMRNLLQQCRFNNCLHIEEPGCAVKEAVEEGKIYMERYLSYYNILESIPENNY
ncbi:ribosome small subunit-dependent GTPase A [Parafilimonas terrae]|uniref:Small ribosomal subunit biogenesis GTPase RsgA n=1 Tax=Parafilimonas terrae TaxID=1465490 RepID=A0A1I5YMC2_9BACT|nr:ribosome small subunit-dependent GTPase A [Parafilimonas terrae]SFQ45434.1 ribosome biogenesis GTPase [Parafilimonas terrae]